MFTRLLARFRIAAAISVFLAQAVVVAQANELGKQPAIRTYMEFADRKNRGIYDSATDSKGYPDEEYDATMVMVINWHRNPESDSELNAVVQYRLVHPE